MKGTDLNPRQKMFAKVVLKTLGVVAAETNVFVHLEGGYFSPIDRVRQIVGERGQEIVL